MTEKGSLIQVSHLDWQKWLKTEHAEGLDKFLHEWAGISLDAYAQDGRAVVALREAYMRGWEDGFTKKFGGE